MKPLTNFQVFGLNFQTWGVFFALAALISFYLFIRLGFAKKKNQDILFNIYFICFFLGILGARLFYFLSHPQNLNLSNFTNFWSGSYELFGGATFALLATISYLLYKKEKVLDYLNLLVIPGLCALFLINTGSFLVMDNIGKITQAPWAINFLEQMRHPIDAYYLVMDLILLGIAVYLYKKEVNYLFFIILLLFSLGRLIIHFFSLFSNNWDIASNLIFWSLSFVIASLGVYFVKEKKLSF